MQSMYTGRMGLAAQQQRVDVIANNIANMNTYGFKSSNVGFKDALYTTMLRPVGGQDGYNLQKGTGVLVSGTTRSFDQGVPIGTGIPFDLMIDGDGFFVVEGQNGEPNYTRNGSFMVSNEGGNRYLINASGQYVLDVNGDRIALPADSSDFTVSTSGEITVDTVAIAQLDIVSFVNKEGLEAISGSNYVETEASGPPQAAQDYVVLQGFLENSNVDMALEMTRLIRAQRAFSLASQAVRTADEMTASANNMRT